MQCLARATTAAEKHDLKVERSAIPVHLVS